MTHLLQLAGRIRWTGETLRFHVPSASRGGLTHLVDLGEMMCSCEWFQFNGGHPCKHILACLIWLGQKVVETHEASTAGRKRPALRR